MWWREVGSSIQLRSQPLGQEQMKTMSRRYSARAGMWFLAAVSVLILVAGVAIGAAAVTKSKPGSAASDMWSPDWLERDWWSLDPLEPARRKRMARHQHYMDHGVPNEYRGQRSPYSLSAEVVAEGGRLYAGNCRDCHGDQGMGDGQMGLAVNPSPALLAFMIQTPFAVDEYLMWSISDGGPLFGTDMPAFKDRLSAAQIWKIIAYMRAGFPSAE